MILNFSQPRFLLAAALLVVAVPAGAQRPDDDARRVAATASLAIEEYAAGVEDGRIVLAEEYDEARLFLGDARRTADRLPASARAGALRAIDTLLAGVEALGPAQPLRDRVDALRRHLEATLGVTLDPMPRSAPSLALGAQAFRAACAQCHGDRGAGDGPLAATMRPPPANLTDPALGETTPLEFFRKINVGVAGTAMPGFEDQLSLEERWSIALYASGLRHDAAARTRGEAVVEAACPACRVVLSDFHLTAGLPDDSVLALAGAAGREDADGVLAWARVAAADEELGGDRALAAQRVTRDATAAVNAALASARRGETAEAARTALGGYLVFERIERAVAARDAAAARDVERAFADLRLALEAGDVPAAETAERRVRTTLTAAGAVFTRSSGAGLLFGQSLLIILREGLEAILIIGALVAFLVRAGATERIREIGWGTVAAIGASFATAGVFAFIFRVSAAHQEILEGLTMLLAAGVLFTVASWLVSKIEAEKWKAFVGGQMKKALSGEGKLALAGLAFLVVYREGFETVLFYAALYSMAETPVGAAGITGGMVVGAVLLAVVYVVIRRFGVKLPLKPIFAGTGILLLILAFSFAGQGVAELQEAGVVGLTPLRWLPALPILGIFPTLQTLAAQLVIASAFLAAVLWYFWLQPRTVATR